MRGVIEPGHLLASGRAADVFDQGDGTVLRRYRTERDSTLEAEAMTWLRSVGFPVPVVHHAAGRDLLMERVTGPTMLADIEARPWTAVAHMRTLARIQRALGAISARRGSAPTTGSRPVGPSSISISIR